MSSKILAFDTCPKIPRSTISLLDNMFSTLMATWGVVPLRCRLCSAGVMDSKVLLFKGAHPKITP